MADDTQGWEITALPEAIEAHYANAAVVWHTPYEFTIDFMTLGSPRAVPDDTVQAQMVTRVKVPPPVVFQIARAIADNVSRYEDQFGKIAEPEGVSRPEPPDPD